MRLRILFKCRYSNVFGDRNLFGVFKCQQCWDRSRISIFLGDYWWMWVRGWEVRFLVWILYLSRVRVVVGERVFEGMGLIYQYFVFLFGFFGLGVVKFIKFDLNFLGLEEEVVSLVGLIGKRLLWVFFSMVFKLVRQLVIGKGGYVRWWGCI